MNTNSKNPLRELAQLFLKLGFIAFGGPAAHIAMMEDEVVERRKWMTRQHFLDLIGATNLIPGPNSTEMTMHIGYEHGGWRGLFVAGASFIGPAVLLSSLLAWAYVQYGALPQAGPFLMGIKPAVIVIILSAVWKLGKKAVKGWQFVVIGLVVLTLSLLGVDALLTLLIGGVGGAIFLYLVQKMQAGEGKNMAAFLLPALAKPIDFTTAVSTQSDVPLWQLGLVFLKIGAVLYGSAVCFSFPR